MSGIAAPQPVSTAGSGIVPQSITATPSHPLTTSSHSHHPKSPAEACDEDSDVGTHASFASHFNQDGSKWERTKTSYKTAILQQVMDRFQSSDGSRATIDQLKEFGITVYLAEHDSVDLFLLRQVVQHVAASKTDRSRSQYDNQRCLLYRDENGRLFNLTLDNGAGGLASTWRGLLASYSGLQAVVAMTVLTRAYACADVAGAVLHPGYLSLVLGLVLHEEISHVWLNVGMFVQGTPSVAAHTLLSRFDSDWPRKLVLLLLALAAAMEAGSAHRRYCTLTGAGLAVVLLAANLGARAWRHMRWKPLRGGGNCPSILSSTLSPAFSLFLAALTGLVFPYIGFQRIRAGGRSAVQLVVANCVIVALIFVASDMDAIQHFLLAGSHACDQDGVNIALGIWLAMTSVACLFAARRVAPGERHPEDGDPILVEEQASPVGYRVPNFPDFPIDPEKFGRKGVPWCSERVEMAVGLVVGVGMGAFVVTTSLYDYMGRANEYIAQGGGSAQAAASELV